MLRWLLLIASTLLVLVYAVNRDIHFERAYTGDLRNRVTGSRMVKDGRSPYFYKWKTGDGLRYYDPGNFDSLRPSNMTSTPFLYRLLSPIAELPESKISAYWLVIEYLILAGIALFAFFQARTTLQKQAVLLVFLLVPLTNGWKEHIAHGQTYLLVPLFAMLFLAFGEIRRYHVWALLAGAAAACMILIRFNTILFFIPFLFMTRGFTRPWLAWFSIPMLLFASWTLSSPHERGLWLDYFDNVKEATRINQKLDFVLVHNTPDPGRHRYSRSFPLCRRSTGKGLFGEWEFLCSFYASLSPEFVGHGAWAGFPPADRHACLAFLHSLSSVGQKGYAKGGHFWVLPVHDCRPFFPHLPASVLYGPMDTAADAGGIPVLPPAEGLVWIDARGNPPQLYPFTLYKNGKYHRRVPLPLRSAGFSADLRMAWCAPGRPRKAFGPTNSRISNDR